MPRLPKVLYNPVSLVGAGLALVMLGSIAVFFAMDMIGASTSPYMGIFTYMILPAIMVFGLLLVPAGIWLERRRLRKTHGSERKYITIDFNNISHRTTFMIFVVSTMMLIVLSAAGTYQAYNYSESVEFCGKVCHEVMKPEYIAYQHSPHARVRCAECHIGEGADWFVKAKISGMYQVYAVTLGTVPRPIETPIRNLRPARETCERCHWPQKFSANLEMAKTYFPIDTSACPPWVVTMQLKIGGGQSELGPTTGIHWHMNTENKIEYISTDDKRQSIPWIQATNLNGHVRVYKSTDANTDDTTMAKGERRTMDCIDCHNRPSHIYYPPLKTINDAMALNKIPHTLPNIRSIASSAIVREYATEQHAIDSIPYFIRKEYESSAPPVFASRRKEIEQSAAEAVRIYSRNFFPAMRVSWKAYPNNIGHMYNDGCFRCHDNKHVSNDGKVLSNDCYLCHTIIAQGPLGKVQSNIAGMEFIHPADVGTEWKENNCSNCHTGE